MKAKTKVEKIYVYKGLGFDVEIHNAPMIESFGEWLLNVDMNELQKNVFKQLAWQQSPFTGNEIAFIRKYLEMTKTAFGKICDLAHSAVSKWEESGDKCIKIKPSNECLIRLHMIDHLQVKDDIFRTYYKNISEYHHDKEKSNSPEPVLIEM